MMLSYLACCGLGEVGWFKSGAVSRARDLRARQQERPGREVAPLEETNATLNMFLNYECQLDDDDMSADDHASDMAALGIAVSVACSLPSRAPIYAALPGARETCNAPPLTPCTVSRFCTRGHRQDAPRSRRGQSAI